MTAAILSRGVKENNFHKNPNYWIYLFLKVFHDKSAKTDLKKKINYIKKNSVGGVKGGEGGKEVDLAKKKWG